MNSKQPVETLTIGRLARLGGVNLETIRYYEREGLLPRPPRTRSGYRMFPRDAAQRLRFIKRAQQLGFALTEIRELLALRVKQGTKRDQIRARAEAKISDIERMQRGCREVLARRRGDDLRGSRSARLRICLECHPAPREHLLMPSSRRWRNEVKAYLRN